MARDLEAADGLFLESLGARSASGVLATSLEDTPAQWGCGSRERWAALGRWSRRWGTSWGGRWRVGGRPASWPHAVRA